MSPAERYYRRKYGEMIGCSKYPSPFTFSLGMPINRDFLVVKSCQKAFTTLHHPFTS